MWPMYILIGVIGGVVGGFFGIGGAVVIVPMLVFAAQFPQHLAQGTSIAALLLPIGLLAAWRYYHAGHINVSAALFIALGFFFGGWFGAHFAEAVSGAILRRSFAVLVIAIGIKMLLGK